MAGTDPEPRFEQESGPGTGAVRSTFRKRFLGNLGSNLVLLFFGLATNIALLRLFVDKLGSSSSGVWIFLASLGEFLLLLDLGMGSALVRFIAGARGRADHLLESCFDRAGRRFFLVASSSAVLITLLLAGPVRSILERHGSGEPTMGLTFLFVGLEAAVTLGFTPVRARLQAIHRYDLVNWVFLGRLTVRFVALMVLLPLIPDMATIAACGLVSTAGANMVIAHLAKPRRGDELKTGPCGSGLWSRLAGYGFWVFLSMVGVRLAYTADTLVLGRFLPPATVTLYYSAWRIVELVRSIGHGAAPFFLPFGSERVGARDHGALPVAFYQGARIVTALTFPLGVVLLGAGGDVLRLWLGPDFTKAEIFLVLLLAPQLLILTFSPASALVFGMGRQRMLVIYSLFAGVLNVGLSIFLTRFLGALGVAVGTTVALTVSLIFNLWFFPRTIGFSRRIYLRIVGRGSALLVAGAVLVRSLAAADQDPWMRLAIATLGGLLFIPTYIAWEFTALERQELIERIRGVERPGRDG